MINFKKEIKPFLINSLVVFDGVQDLIDKYRIYENEKFYNGKQDEIDLDLERYETKYADLFLVAYANYLKKQNKKVILITEESFGKDKKLVEKLPVICKKDNEDIWCRNIPYALFEFYKDELDFSLNFIKLIIFIFSNKKIIL